MRTLIPHAGGPPSLWPPSRASPLTEQGQAIRGRRERVGRRVAGVGLADQLFAPPFVDVLQPPCTGLGRQGRNNSRDEIKCKIATDSCRLVSCRMQCQLVRLPGPQSSTRSARLSSTW